MRRLGAIAVLLVGCGSRTGLSTGAGEAASCRSTLISVLATGPTADAHDVLVPFDPDTAVFGAGVTVPCLGPGPPMPTVLAVDHAGVTLIAGSSIDTHLYRIDPAKAGCTVTGFQPSYSGFGLTFVADPAHGEALYAVKSGDRLVQVDTTTFSETAIGTLDPGALALITPMASDLVLLAGDRTGDLLRFDREIPAPPPPNPGAPNGMLDSGLRRATSVPGTSGTIWQVDRRTASESAAWALPTAASASPLGSCGFARWGGDFYFFEQASGGTDVWRFRPADGSLAYVTHTTLVILAAGAAPCASR